MNTISKTLNSEGIACNYWSKNNYSRIYFGEKLFCEILDIYYERYNTGNLCYISIGNEKISNSLGRDILGELNNFKVYFDLRTLKLEVKGECRYDDEIINYMKGILPKITSIIEEERKIKDILQQMQPIYNLMLMGDEVASENYKNWDKIVFDFEEKILYVYKGFLITLEKLYNISEADICLYLKATTGNDFRIAYICW